MPQYVLTPFTFLARQILTQKGCRYALCQCLIPLIGILFLAHLRLYCSNRTANVITLCYYYGNILDLTLLQVKSFLVLNCRIVFRFVFKTLFRFEFWYHWLDKDHSSSIPGITISDIPMAWVKERNLINLSHHIPPTSLCTLPQFISSHFPYNGNFNRAI